MSWTRERAGIKGRSNGQFKNKKKKRKRPFRCYFKVELKLWNFQRACNLGSCMRPDDPHGGRLWQISRLDVIRLSPCIA